MTRDAEFEGRARLENAWRTNRGALRERSSRRGFREESSIRDGREQRRGKETVDRLWTTSEDLVGLH